MVGKNAYTVINTVMKKVVIYPGRFQPMLAHHAEVYRKLQAQFPDAEVYIGTSDKVELPNSPFSFKEKQMIAQGLGIDPRRVLLAPRPYHQEDYAHYFDAGNTVIIFAVGEKDVERFPFSNVDPKTGLDMTVRGAPRPKYYQKINTYNANPLPMKERGYIMFVPNVMVGNQTASASAFRDALAKAPDRQAAEEVFTKLFGTMNNKVFDLIYNKVTGSKMNEELNKLRKLAGLPPLAESAPVEFESQVDPKNAQFTEPTKASMKFSIANRFPKGADLNNPAVKKEQFLNALLRSPESLLGEFSERLDPTDDASLDIGAKIDDIQSKLMKTGGKLANLSREDKTFVLELAGVAVDRMSLVAGDNSPAYDPEQEPELESVNLDHVRESFGVMEDSSEEVKQVLFHRLRNNPTDMQLISDYGLKEVMDAIEDVASGVGNLDEIGSSDISAWMNSVRRLLKSVYGEKKERKPMQLGPEEHWDSSKVGKKIQYLTRDGEYVDEAINTTRTIYDRDGIMITSHIDETDPEGAFIAVYINGEPVAVGDHDPYSGFWFSKLDGGKGDISFDTPAEIAQYFEQFKEGMGDNIEPVEGGPRAGHYMGEPGSVNESKKAKKVNPYAVGMASAMKSTGDKPPLKKSTIKKGHKIAKAVAKDAKLDEVSDDTLRSYRVKAKKDANDNYNNARDTGMYSKEPDKGKKAFAMMKQSKKRQAGVKKASDRLGVSIYDESLREGEDSAKLTASQRKQLQKITKGQSLNLYAWANKVLDKGTISSAEAKKLANLMSEKSKVNESAQSKESVGSIIKRVLSDKLTWKPGFSKLYGDSRTTKKEKVTDYKMKYIHVDGTDAEHSALATALQAELSAAGYNVIGQVGIYDHLVMFQVRTPHSNGLTEGTMTQGIFDPNPRKAMAALQGMKNVMRDALPASQAADILHRYVFDDELFDLIDALALRKHNADIRSDREVMARIKYLRSEAENDIAGENLQENPALLAVGGALGRVVAGGAARAGAGALGQAVARGATSVAVNKTLGANEPVEESSADLSTPALSILINKSLRDKGVGEFSEDVIETWIEGDGPGSIRDVMRLDKAVEKFIGPKTWNRYTTMGRSLDKLLYELGLGPLEAGGVKLDKSFDVDESLDEDDNNTDLTKLSTSELFNLIGEEPSEVDFYQMFSNPQTPAQKELQRRIEDEYYEVAALNRLHPDDDFEEVLDIFADRFIHDLQQGN